MKRFRLWSTLAFSEGAGTKIRPWRVGIAGVVAIAATTVTAVVARPSWASDHEDAPSLATTDKGADIADVYAFMRPASSSHLVLGMTVHPNATATTTFDTKVEYQFRVLGYDEAAQAFDPTVDTRVTCRFETPDVNGKQLVLCHANGFSTFATAGDVGTTDANAPLRIYAGLRADPAFADMTAVKNVITTKQLGALDGGVTNTFANKNVLAIVVEVDIDKVLLAGVDAAATGRPKLAVSGTTERL